jgi:hypothetical protein
MPDTSSLYTPEKAPDPDMPASSRRVKIYWREIERYKRAAKEWMEEARAIESLYLEQDRKQGSSTRRFSLLWANIETLKPAVYAKLPVIECSRRFKDPDPVARKAGELMERCVNTSLEIYDVDEVFQMVRDDRLLAGRGTPWVRYEATIEREEAVEENVEDDADVAERLAEERLCVDYVHWGDFGHNVCGVWRDVWLVWRCVYKTREEIKERFGEKVATAANYDAKMPGMLADRGASSPGEMADEYCRIYEIWDKRAKVVTWISEGMNDSAMDEGEPPIDFAAFFPCPRPAYSTHTSKSLIPRPDYVYYRDQAKEINDLTDKISNMMDWLVVKAFVPGSPSRVADAIEEVIRSNDNREMFVQVDDMRAWTEGGGAAKLIDWMPIDMIISAIQAAVAAREQLIQDVFQITGLSDILRGATDPNETLGAQELKSQTSSRRLRNTKDEISRMCRDVGRLCAEVVAQKFEPETIAALTGYSYEAEPLGVAMPGIQVVGGNGGPPLPQPGMPQQLPMQGAAPEGASPTKPLTFGPAEMQLLRDDRLRSFRIDVETDSTGQADEAAEQQRATEFVTSVDGFINNSIPTLQAAPELAPLMGEMLGFIIRRFRAGRGLEESAEKAYASVMQRASAAQNAEPSPDPAAIKAQADAQATQQKMQADAQAQQQAMMMAQQQHQQALEMAQQQHQLDMQAQQQKTQGDLAIIEGKLAVMQAQAENAQREHEMRMAEMAIAQQTAQIAAEQKARAESEGQMEADAGPQERGHDPDRSESALAEILAGNQRLIASLAGPRKIAIERGPGGKAIGATSTLAPEEGE